MNKTTNKPSIYNPAQQPSHYSLYPLSPFTKVSTPHRTRINSSSPNIHIHHPNFSSALHHQKSPNNKENAGSLMNQSPIIHRLKANPYPNSSDKNSSPILMMSKKSSRASPHQHHKFESLHNLQQNTFNQCTKHHKFEDAFMSLTGKLPQSPQNKQKMPKMGVSNNFKSILQAQQYQIKVMQMQNKKTKDHCLKKSSSTNQYNIKLFNPSLQNIQKNMISNQFDDKQSLRRQCLNRDGNEAKYETIVSEDNNERLFYCSKCTVLLVNQGFILEQIKYNQNSEQLYKIEACKGKLQGLINDLQRMSEIECLQLSQYYQNLKNVIAKCRQLNEETLKQLYRRKIDQYRAFLQQMELYHSNQLREEQFQAYYNQIIQQKVSEAFFKKFPTSFLKNIQQQFRSFCHQNILLKFEQAESSQSKSPQSLISRNHGLRFSFQKLLCDINSKKNKMQDFINILQQEQEQESDVVEINTEKCRRAAFRDLFPESEENSQINCGVNSPTFKHF